MRFLRRWRYQSRHNYWSDSKLADLIRGTKKPHAATSAQWMDWKIKASQLKIRYWIAEQGLSCLQDIVFFPMDTYKNIHSYIMDRFIVKSYLVDTKLKRNQWHETSERMLHANFQLLVEYIETEKASIYVNTRGPEERHKLPFRFRYYWSRWFFLTSFRSEEYAFKYMEWEAWLDKQGHVQGYSAETVAPQGLDAQEMISLYTWWKDRVNRIDPYDTEDYKIWAKEDPKMNKKSVDYAAYYQKKKDAIKRVHDLEEAQNKEDELMLIRLIKIRNSLWT